MRFPIITTLLFALTIVLHLACSDSVLKPTIIDTDGCIRIGVNEQFIVTLELNPSTGYMWYFIEPVDSTILKLVNHSIEDYPGTELLMGRVQLERWTFLALARGSSSLKLEYTLAWDSTSATDTVEYRVEVI